MRRGNAVIYVFVVVDEVHIRGVQSLSQLMLEAA